MTRPWGLVVWRQTSARYDGPPLPEPITDPYNVPEGGVWHRRWRVYRTRPPYALRTTHPFGRALGSPRLRPRRGPWRTVRVRRPGPSGYVPRGYIGMART